MVNFRQDILNDRPDTLECVLSPRLQEGRQPKNSMSWTYGLNSDKGLPSVVNHYILFAVTAKRLTHVTFKLPCYFLVNFFFYSLQWLKLWPAFLFNPGHLSNTRIFGNKEIRLFFFCAQSKVKWVIIIIMSLMDAV